MTSYLCDECGEISTSSLNLKLCPKCKSEDIGKYEITSEDISKIEDNRGFATDEDIRNHWEEIKSKSPMQILKRSDLLHLIDREFDKKIEGEREARIAIFLTFLLRKVNNRNKATDNLMVNDTGGTGKDHVVSAVFNINPDSEKVQRVRITPKVLNYLNDTKTNPEGWIGKCLYLEDVTNTTINDDGFKVMLSADPAGKTETSIVVNNTLRNINIVGKPALVITVANTNPKQESLRRLPIVNLTSSVDQTKAVIRKQAKFAEYGVSPEYDPSIKTALAHLKNIKVRIPFATKVGNAFPAGNVIVRTHFPRFLDYIKSSCALHQFQREKDADGYYIATRQDYEIARGVLSTTTSNALMIPLTKNQRLILEKFRELGKDNEFSFADLQDHLQHVPLQNRWLRAQIERLVENGFLKRRNDKQEHSNKPVCMYSYGEVEELVLPHFEDLDILNPTNTTSSTIKTNNANTANKGVFAVNAVNALKFKVEEMQTLKEKPYDTLKRFIRDNPRLGVEMIAKGVTMPTGRVEKMLQYLKDIGEIYESKNDKWEALG